MSQSRFKASAASIKRVTVTGRAVLAAVAIAVAVGVFGAVSAAQTPPRGADAAAQAGRAMQRYESKSYIVITDLPPELAREAVVRMTRMADEYRNRTRDFSGAIRERFPFYLHATLDGYHAAGGLPGTAGYFDRLNKTLNAVAYADDFDETWNTVQHEGFHQFAHALISSDLPVWLNEGLAEYFGEAIFTGDGFVSGVVNPNRLRIVQALIRSNNIVPMDTMLQLTLPQWNQIVQADPAVAAINYNQSWAMVHFMVHADDGKYRKAFASYIMAMSRGATHAVAWKNNFGTTEGLEKAWREYWLAMSPDASRDLATEALVDTVMSYVARAHLAGQTPQTPEAFFSAAAAGKLAMPEADWLPPRVMRQASATAPRFGTWTFEPREDAPPVVMLETRAGVRIRAQAEIKEGMVASVKSTVDDLARVITEVKELQQAGKSREARRMLAEAMRRNTGSPSMPEAQKLYREM